MPTSIQNSIGVTKSQSFTSLHTGYATSFNIAALNTAFQRSYYYDQLGRVILSNIIGNATQKVFAFDSHAQLAAVATYGKCAGTVVSADNGGNYSSCTALLDSVGFSYDSVGNRKDLGALYVTGNRLVRLNGDTMSYDSDGNLTHKYKPSVINQYIYWNPENRLDSFGQRLSECAVRVQRLGPAGEEVS